MECLAAILDIRRKTFKKSTIYSAFAKTGLILFNPEAVLQKIKLVTLLPLPIVGSTKLETTPLTIQTLKRHADYLYQNTP